MGRPAKRQPQYFNGVAFYWKPPGYYKSDDGVYLHRAVWEHHNGPIPDKHHIHHKDGDRANCASENLECLSPQEHHAEHVQRRLPELREHMRVVMQPKAAEWHGSEEGIDFHRKLGAASWANRPLEDRVCTVCGKTYQGRGKVRSGYCGPACQQRARRMRRKQAT